MEPDNLPERLSRYATARHRARQMLAYLTDHGDGTERHRKARIRLADCGEYLCFHHYYTVGETRLAAASFCKQHLICPLCAIRRGAKSLKAYLDRFTVIHRQYPLLRPYLVTFTVRNGEDLRERFDHLHASLRRLHERRRDWLKKGRGWTESAKAHGAVWSYEVTNVGNGWHPHVHSVWLCYTPPDQRRLRDEWERITGDSFMVDVRPIAKGDDGSYADGFCEVFKYALKFSALSISDNLHAWDILSGRRLLGSFGVFRGVDIPEELTDEPLDDLPYVELFYRYVNGSGYRLTRATTYDCAPAADAVIA